jgi:steroid 5-alpha reductase family enzyme
VSVAWAGLAVAALLMVAAWVASVLRRDVSIVDALWGPAIAASGVAYLLAGDEPAPRGLLAVTLAATWAARLSAHVLWRNHGKPEDRRYREIRARNDPGFWWKSLYLVFALQAVLAWIVGLPLLGAALAPSPLGLLDAAGLVLWLTGFTLESVADLQLARFQRQGGAGAAARGVMDRGLWRYSRHPNYFGEFCLWWGLWLIAAAGGAWWTAVGPALLTFLLLRVSGVALTEKDIAGRRPDYRDYVRRTSAFFPRPPRATQ